MHVEADKLVTTLLTSAAEVSTLIAHAKSRDAALYLQGSRDMLLVLAKTFQQSCPLAVNLFNGSVTVTKEAKDGH